MMKTMSEMSSEDPYAQEDIHPAVWSACSVPTSVARGMSVSPSTAVTVSPVTELTALTQYLP